MPRRRWWLGVLGLCLAAVVAGLALELRPRWAKRVRAAWDDPRGSAERLVDRLPWAAPNVRWESSTPESEGMDGPGLERLWDRLAAKDTYVLLVARNGRIVFERYSRAYSPNRRIPNAAMAKTATAAMVVLLALTDGRLSLEDPLWRFIPEWKDDPERSRISIRHLVTHSAGLDDVRFDREQEGWKRDYLKDRAARFDLALHRAPVRFEPGTRYAYSGLGFYVLAYALGRSLAETPEPSIGALLEQRLMDPLGIPRRAWKISYGESYDVDGLELYAIGSGAEYTPRALARIGQLLLDRGRWQGRQLVASQFVDAMLTYGGSPPTRSGGESDPSTGVGTWLNCDGFWRALPRDAAIGAGRHHQVLLVVPSLGLVVVRMGGSLGVNTWEGDFWRALEPELFEPLAAAITTPGEPTDRIACGR